MTVAPNPSSLTFNDGGKTSSLVIPPVWIISRQSSRERNFTRNYFANNDIFNLLYLVTKSYISPTYVRCNDCIYVPGGLITNIHNIDNMHSIDGLFPCNRPQLTGEVSNFLMEERECTAMRMQETIHDEQRELS